MTESLKILGLGSIVEVDDMDALADTLYFVIARAIGKDGQGKTILRYQVAPHPGGAPEKDRDLVLTIAEAAITKVVFEGYLEEKDEAYLEDLVEGLTGVVKKSGGLKKTPALSAVPTPATPTPSPAKVEDEKALLQKDAFYKFRKKDKDKGEAT